MVSQREREKKERERERKSKEPNAPCPIFLITFHLPLITTPVARAGPFDCMSLIHTKKKENLSFSLSFFLSSFSLFKISYNKNGTVWRALRTDVFEPKKNIFFNIPINQKSLFITQKQTFANFISHASVRAPI